jgi:hypothetical protein
MVPEQRVHYQTYTTCHLVREEHCRMETRYSCKLIPEEKVEYIPYTTCHMVPEERCEVLKCQRCKLVPEDRCVQVPYVTCHMVPKECVRLVPQTTCTLEPYCVTTKVCRRVPVCVPVCPPCCPHGPVSAVPSVHERLARCACQAREERDAGVVPAK